MLYTDWLHTERSLSNTMLTYRRWDHYWGGIVCPHIWRHSGVCARTEDKTVQVCERDQWKLHKEVYKLGENGIIIPVKRGEIICLKLREDFKIKYWILLLVKWMKMPTLHCTDHIHKLRSLNTSGILYQHHQFSNALISLMYHFWLG